MAITLMPSPYGSHEWLAGDHLQIIGDVHDTLIIPVPRPKDIGGGHVLNECYYIAVSDGSLIRATNDPDRPDFVVLIAGLGQPLIAPDGLSISIPAAVRWVTLSPNRHSYSVAPEPMETAPLFA